MAEPEMNPPYEKKDSFSRRKFLKTATAAVSGAAAFVAGAQSLAAQEGESQEPRAERAGESGASAASGRPGSDHMVDVFKALGLEYIAWNPHSFSMPLQESIINYGGNAKPELLTCLHEEVAAAMAHGYFKIEGKPMGACMYCSVGLQHAAMAVYSAFCDQVPVYLILGNQTANPNTHSVQDPALMVRDYTKWDEQPVSLQQFTASAIRAYTVMMTPPHAPVCLSIDSAMQEEAIAKGTSVRIPKLSPNIPPQAADAAVRDVARMLVEAEFPVLVTERAARTSAGLDRMIELAELLQAGVVDDIMRMNFPSNHPLNQDSGALKQADVVLALEHPRIARNALKPGAKLIMISTADLGGRSNYWNFGRYEETDLAIAADAEATLPSLIEEVKRLVTSDKKNAFTIRGKKLADAHQKNREADQTAAAYGWDSNPISTARIAAEVWAQIKNKDWSLVSPSNSLNGWVQHFWDFKKYYHHIGQSGAVSQGYVAPSSVGAALANRKYGRLSVNLQSDGDLMYLPNSLWTAAHHKIPMLTVMFNNRGYIREIMESQTIAGRRNRKMTDCGVGTLIDAPFIDYAKLAQSMGWYAEGPISDPKELAPALKRALAVVERGEPALLDTVTQPI
jgi:acetolactate synthase I/II/III large subunit